MRETPENKRARAAEIVRRLKQAYPNSRCSLNFRTPFQLLVATMLSAQCTDERVNKVTKDLFKRYKKAADFAEGPLDELEEMVRSTGFYRNKAKNIRAACVELVEKYKGKVPGKLDELVTRIVGDESRLRVVHASQIVTMEDPPADSVRKKKNSSMRVAIDLVKSGEAQACVSAGNTGALMATAKFVLKMLPGIDRPAIIAELPSTVGTMHMLDIGANTVCTADHLFQFAVMGSIVTADVAGIEAPKIALLNIGAEDTKGHESIRDAAAMLTASTMNYIGFIEGSELFSGDRKSVV